MSETPNRNAAQLTQLQSHYESQLQQIVSAMTLRKWLIERMIDKMAVTGTFDVVGLLHAANELHDFITTPATDGLKPPPPQDDTK